MKHFIIYKVFLSIIMYNSFFTNFILKIKLNKYYKERMIYLLKHNKIYNESNLITIGDKINWLIIHDTNSLKGKCADKILIHKYSKKKLGKDICNKIIKIYNNINEIKLNELPNKFVIKTNHGSGFNVIVNEKKKFDLINTKKKLNNWMNLDYGKKNAEFHYSFINIFIIYYY